MKIHEALALIELDAELEPGDFIMNAIVVLHISNDTTGRDVVISCNDDIDAVIKAGLTVALNDHRDAFEYEGDDID